MDRIARALFEHGSIQKAAAELGMSEATVSRWKQKPGFQEVYSEIQREAWSRTIGRLLQASPAAASTIVKTMVDPNATPAVRLRAAQSVLEHGQKFQEKPERDETSDEPIPVIVLPRSA